MQARTFRTTSLFVAAIGLCLLHGCGDGSDESTFGEKGPKDPNSGPGFDGGFFTGSDSGANQCKVADQGEYTPTWKPPTAWAQNVCSPAVIAEYYDKCLSSNGIGSSSCLEYEKANAACAQCLRSAESAKTYGPVIALGTRAWSLNVPGCVAREVGDLSDQGCGAAKQANIRCKHASCTSCLSSPEASLNDWLNCQGEAGVTAACQVWVRADNAACLGLDQGPCSTNPQESSQAFYLRLARLWCGDGQRVLAPSSGDAGSD